MQRGFLLIPLVIALGLIGLSGVIYYRYSDIKQVEKNEEVLEVSPADEEGEKVYSGLGFEFKYSVELEVKEDSEEEYNRRGNGDFRKNFTSYVQYAPAEFLGAVSVLKEDKDFDKAPLTIWVFNNPNGLTPEGFYNEYWYYPFLWGMFNPPDKKKDAPNLEATISGKLAKGAEISYQINSPKYFNLNSGGKMYLFRVLSGGEEILGSFKFLE
ncbi:MAG: hypothetical protein ACD_30C00014G0005 [uncultured bacterium]|uniref:Uncharacterized protein n=3 Tax=Candidatus Daviesiibacteriota TaxID=1752718 RepID=A0A0G0I1L1_9BACT|nr:MAG: hypothetical protein ACD_30C00014G0005 [uncultured bacterium]KKQ10006.1 MAG: hypothetical protein US19_C0009G0008 [Candidatus Daviesbacteria bacterium GW2011_GWB1_36_5]KKQ14709.1 MAG: hypothetical protein US28_C0032G0011 [Candidatus Daviesbacteria bacterium GW2011_GWA1_36_8]OGE33101.1 MAG: hypothetical protein A3C99_03690 [Candidatus Daviesbacteria bacterium RIFCSPHIGHO2_02_FULL_37_9]OGE36699.1 MAG: hypothetical protein A3E66_02090 [Candidatus Daviesbacteria bacterium RIFCSPHIGHO2_12_FU